LDNARRNVWLLACSQALLLTNAVTLISIGGLAGYELAPAKALATLPPFSYVIGAAIATIPASFWMRRVGRRNGFLTGAAFGLAGAVLSTVAMALSSFVLLCLGSLLLGVYNAFGQYYRFAAADVAPADFKARAISYVLAGGLVGGIVGPEMSKHTIGLAEPRFIASYASLILYSLLAMAIISRLAIARPRAGEEAQGEVRPLGRIVRQPAFIVAALCAGLGYGVMTLLMTATPLAMGFCGHPYSAAATVIAGHVVAMFAPSFFTGSLIQRFGVLPVIATGVLIEAGCVAIAFTGQGIAHFQWALALLGIGWNFMYVGGSTLLTETYRPAEKAKVQGLNEFIVFGVQATASLSSGVLINVAGWSRLIGFSIPLLAAAMGAVLYLAASRRAATPS